MDYGTDNYAGVTYNNAPNGDRIFIGWMSNWDYARDTPTEKWRSAMTVPRKLTLQKKGEAYLLASNPVAGIDALAQSSLASGVNIPANTSKTLKIDGLNQSQMQLKTTAKEFKLIFKNDLDETLELALDSKRGIFLLDRMKSGKVDFQPEFGNKKHYMPIGMLHDGTYEMKIMLDWSSIEIFMDGGLFVMTEQIFPSEPYNTLIIDNKDAEGDILLESVKRMESVWQ